MNELQSKLLKTGLLVAGTFFIDGMIHKFFTSPFEPSYYFMVKMLVVGILGFIMFGIDMSYPKIALFTTIFVLVFSLYYRLFELVNDFPIGYVAPEFILFGKHFASNLAKAILWTITHSLAFFIPSMLIKELIGDD